MNLKYQGRYFIFESLRNAYNLIMEHLHDWVTRKAVFELRADYSPQLYEFWVSLGLDSEFASLLGELGLAYRGGRLLVASERKGDPDLFEKCIYRNSISIC